MALQISNGGEVSNLTWEVPSLQSYNVREQPASACPTTQKANTRQMRTVSSPPCLLAFVKVDSVVKVPRIVYNAQTIDKVKI